MKKSILILLSCLILFSYSFANAETVTENDIQLRNDVIYILLYPFIQKELDKQYGNAPQTECDKIIQIKKLPIGTYLFHITVQAITFEGAHGPPNDLVTITFSNEKTLEWRAFDFKRKRLKENEIPKWCN